MILSPTALRPLAIFAMCALVMAAGCSKKPKPGVVPTSTTTDTSTPTDTGNNTTTETPSTSGDTGAKLQVEDVFFDYDRFALRDDAREVLNTNGKAMLASTSSRFLLEGHCDERGTVEYNLALGEKRANSAKDYLVRYGVDGSRMSTVSFGEERPFDPGHDESAWEANRRVHFVQQ